MKSFFIKSNLKLIQKICISGIFIAILIVLNKVIAINYIPIIPFVRVTIGSGAFAIFASLVLGPLYGGAVCVASDVLGYFIFDPKTLGFFPSITLIYLLLGVLPYFLFCLVNLFKNKKVMALIEYLVFILILVGVSIFFINNDSLSLFGTTYNLELYQKILIISLMGVFFLTLVIVNVILDKKVKTNNVFNVYQISLVTFLNEIIVMVLFAALMKSIAFGFDMFLPILISSLILMFLNIPLNTYLIFVILKIANRYIILNIEGDEKCQKEVNN